MKQSNLLKERIIQGTLLAGLLIIMKFALLGGIGPGSKLWMLWPFTLVPIAGALGGAIVHYINPYDCRAGWPKQIRIVISILVFGSLILGAFVLGMSRADKL